MRIVIDDTTKTITTDQIAWCKQSNSWELNRHDYYLDSHHIDDEPQFPPAVYGRFDCYD